MPLVKTYILNLPSAHERRAYQAQQAQQLGLDVVFMSARTPATQYALLSSMMLLLPKFIAGFSGDFVNAHGYAAFFNATAWLGLPVLILVGLAWHYQPPDQDQ